MRLFFDPAGKYQLNLQRMAPTVNFQRSEKFPPGPGQWFQAPDTVILGCLRCKGHYGVNPNCHTILPDGQLQPSWTCILCGSHTIVRLANYEAKP